MIQPSKNHKLEPLGLTNFFAKNSSEFRKKLEKNEKRGKIDSPLYFQG